MLVGGFLPLRLHVCKSEESRSGSLHPSQSIVFANSDWEKSESSGAAVHSIHFADAN